jgi:hypothetical protein
MIHKGSAKIKHTIKNGGVVMETAAEKAGRRNKIFDGFGMMEILNQDPIISFGVSD